MADERDFELLDDYLTNRMQGQDRAAFEQRLQSDSELYQEYTLQKRVIQGIRDARIAQLKSMLNQVPVPSGSAGNAIASKVIIGAVVAMVIVAAAIWFSRDEAANKQQSVARSEQKADAPAEEPARTNAEPQTETAKPSAEDQQTQDSDRNQTSAGTEHSKPSLAKRPDPVSGPAGDSSPATNDAPEATSSGVEVNVSMDSRYAFHYQLNDGSLTLYGPFEKAAYEIVTFQENGNRLISLYYNDKYYLLTESAGTVHKLRPITDTALIRKLQDQRTSK